MIDLYLLSIIINSIWYLFTILFVLYRFTSFFSYIYNFARFCGKIFVGIKYLGDQIVYRFTNNPLHNDIEAQTSFIQKEQPETIYQMCKNKLQSYYYSIFGKPNINSPYYRSRSRNVFTETTYHNPFTSSEFTTKQMENEMFNNHFNELCANESVLDTQDVIYNNTETFKTVDLNSESSNKSAYFFNTSTQTDSVFELQPLKSSRSQYLKDDSTIPFPLYKEQESEQESLYQEPQQELYQESEQESLYQEPQQELYQEPQQELYQEPQQELYQEPLYQELYQAPLYQAPLYQAPLYQEPLYQEPLYQEPLYQEPLYQEPLYQEPLYQAPLYQAPLYQDPYKESIVKNCTRKSRILQHQDPNPVVNNSTLKSSSSFFKSNIKKIKIDNGVYSSDSSEETHSSGSSDTF